MLNRNNYDQVEYHAHHEDIPGISKLFPMKIFFEILSNFTFLPQQFEKWFLKKQKNKAIKIPINYSTKLKVRVRSNWLIAYLREEQGLATKERRNLVYDFGVLLCF